MLLINVCNYAKYPGRRSFCWPAIVKDAHTAVQYLDHKAVGMTLNKITVEFQTTGKVHYNSKAVGDSRLRPQRHLASHGE